MKKVFILLAVMVIMGLSAFAAPRPIRVVQKPSEDSEAKKGRSIVILPTASIDGQVLTIEFCEATTSQVIVKGQSAQVVVYNSTFASGQVVITLPSLPVGEYQLEIEQGDYVYIGEFDIE